MHARCDYSLDFDNSVERVFEVVILARRRVGVLKFVSRTQSRLVHDVEERLLVFRVYRPHRIFDSLVFLEEVFCAKVRPLAHLSDDVLFVAIPLFGRNLVQEFCAEASGDFFHLVRYCGVVVREVAMVSARRDDVDVEIVKRPVCFFDNGIIEVGKINEIHAAERNRALVHKSARLAEERVFGILRGFCLEHRAQL